MVLGPEELVELKSSKIQLEVGLIYLKRKRTELEKQKGRLEKGPRDRASQETMAQVLAELDGVVREVASREQAIRQLADQISQGESQGPRAVGREDVDEMLAANEGMASELAAIRAEILQGLRALAEPLRRHQEIADRKSRLVQRIGTSGGKDLGYPNYIECALLRQDEYDDALRYVLEALKRQRVVA
jgi:hypothetical protein